MKPPFLITIDTEGDNLWENTGQSISTRNTGFLARFQDLCQRFGFKPTWLTNYEMAMDPAFVEFGRDVIVRGAGEIGMHLHAWNSPPLVPLTVDDFRYHPYLVEYPDAVMRDKVGSMTALLEERFRTKMLSHRAGRWAFDARYARVLVDCGYIVDCSVTPGVSWSANKGAPAGRGGSDYRNYPSDPYYLDSDDISKPGASQLLEVPMTCRRSPLARVLPLAYGMPIIRNVATYIAPEVLWLRPNGQNLAHMLLLVQEAVTNKDVHLEFMLHSSELMPGGSPTFVSESHVDALYRDLEALFSAISPHFKGATLGEFALNYGAGQKQ